MSENSKKEDGLSSNQESPSVILAKLRVEDKKLATESSGLENKLLKVRAVLVQIEKDLLIEKDNPEDVAALQEMKNKSTAEKDRLDGEITKIKERRVEIKTEIETLNEEISASKLEKGGKPDSTSKKTKGGEEDNKKRQKKDKGRTVRDLKDLPDPTAGAKADDAKPGPAPTGTSKNPSNNPPGSKGPQPAQERILWVDKGYIRKNTEEEGRLKDWVQDREEQLARTDIADIEERSLIEKERLIAERHIQVLGELKEIIENTKKFEYKGNIPRIDLDTRSRENNSGWRNRAYLAQLKNVIRGLKLKIEDLEQDLQKTSEPRTSQVHKEIAVRKLHLEKMAALLDEILSTPKKSAPSPKDATGPTPSGNTTPPAAPKKSGQKKGAAVQSNTTNTQMTSEKDFAEEALDTAGFAKYAAEAGDAKGLSVDKLQESLENKDDPGKLLFETFQKLESFKEDLKNLFREDAEGIVEYDDADFESIQKYMEDNRVKNPEKIAEIMRQLEQVKEDRKLIREKEKRIEELLSQREAKIKEYVEAKKKEYETATKEGAKDFLNTQNKTGWLNVGNIKKWWSHGYWREGTAKAALEKELAELPAKGAQMAVDAGTTRDIDTELTTTQTEKGAIEERYTEMRAVILQNKNFAQSIHEAANKKVAERINKMLQDQDKEIESVDEEQAMLERINAMREAGTSFTYLNQTESRDFQKEIDIEAEKTVNKEIDKALAEIDLDEGGQYSKLESSLVKFIKKEQLGSKNGPATKTFVLTTLKTKLAKTKKFSRGQALLLSHLIKKVEAAKI